VCFVDEEGGVVMGVVVVCFVDEEGGGGDGCRQVGDA
jgi:hypothetical protein